MKTHTGMLCLAPRYPPVTRASPTTPTVLAASCIPCPSDMKNAETDWRMRKIRFSRPGWPRRKIHSTASITRYPSTKPTSGDSTIGIKILLTMPDQKMTPSGTSNVAPTSPPNRACEDDDGIPKYQVIRFQMVAPTRPANTRPSPATPLAGLMTSLPTVAATWPPRNDPIRLPTAAMASAIRGVSARVETEVAIALAASWKPLV